MIQHLKIDFPPLLKFQVLLDLGRVNILTGRNSSGKSTVLRKILEKPDFGMTYEASDEIEAIVRGQIGDYSTPSHDEVDTWVEKILDFLSGEIFFTSSKQEAHALVLEAKKLSQIIHYNLDSEALRIANALISIPSQVDAPVLLSPKRRLPTKTMAGSAQALDPEAALALSRLFFLNHQPSGSAERTVFDNIFTSFRNITGSEFEIQILPNEPPITLQLLFRRAGAAWIAAQNEGLGLAELLSILLYSLDGSYRLLLIEEPENHLHPDLQRKLLAFFNSVTARQFILSTHSPVFLNPTMVDRIYFCKYENSEIKIDDNTSRADALSNIGVLAIDNLTSDAVIITEGKTDQIFIDHIVMKWLDAPPSSSISYVFLAGSMMMYFDPTPFAQLRSTFALIDLDTSNASAQKAFMSACSSAGIVPTQLKRYCLENYYPLHSIQKVFGELVPSSTTSHDPMTPPWTQLADKLHDESWWKGELKSARRVTSILKHMTLKDLEETDLLQFCSKLKGVL